MRQNLPIPESSIKNILDNTPHMINAHLFTESIFVFRVTFIKFRGKEAQRIKDYTVHRTILCVSYTFCAPRHLII